MTLELDHCMAWAPAPGQAGELGFGGPPCGGPVYPEGWVVLNHCMPWSPQPGAPVLFDFGSGPCVPVEPPVGHDLAIQAAMPAPYSDIRIDLQETYAVAISAALGPPVSALDITYDRNIPWHGIVGKTAGAWEAGTRIKSRRTCAPFRQAARAGVHNRSRFQATARERKAWTCAGWKQTGRAAAGRCAIWSEAQRERTDCITTHWQQNGRVHAKARGEYQETAQAGTTAGGFSWITLRRTERPITAYPWMGATLLPDTWCASAQDARPAPSSHCVGWARGTRRAGWGGRLPPASPQPPPEPPCYDPAPGWAPLELFGGYVPVPALDFRCPGEVPIPPGETIVVPIRRIYFMANSASLTRVADGAEIPVTGLTAAIDADSWTWTISAEAPASALSLVEDDGSGPVELEAEINGHKWRWLAEWLRRNRTFSSRTIHISGRGVAAQLDEPYAAVQTFTNTTDRTIVQLMEDALTVNGVPMGWTLDASEITDWLVPAGAWDFTGSHIAAIRQIAASIEALVQADPTGQTIRIRPRYPHLPWRWADDVTPDIVLPESVVVAEGLEWLKSPSHNAVYVSGKTHGVLGRAYIDGTAGDDYAEMATHELITHADAVRQRGGAILGATGRRQRLTLSMPLGGDTALPVVTPGTFVDYAATGIALARGVRISAGRPAVRQTVDLEVYLGR